MASEQHSGDFEQLLASLPKDAAAELDRLLDGLAATVADAVMADAGIIDF